MNEEAPPLTEGSMKDADEVAKESFLCLAIMSSEEQVMITLHYYSFMNESSVSREEGVRQNKTNTKNARATGVRKRVEERILRRNVLFKRVHCLKRRRLETLGQNQEEDPSFFSAPSSSSSTECSSCLLEVYQDCMDGCMMCVFLGQKFLVDEEKPRKGRSKSILLQIHTSLSLFLDLSASSSSSCFEPLGEKLFPTSLLLLLVFLSVSLSLIGILFLVIQDKNIERTAHVVLRIALEMS